MTDFSEFWALYPKKVAKKDAEKAWKKLTATQQLKAIEALPNHVARWEDPEFTPHGASWLNGERFEDQLEERRPVIKQVVAAWWTSNEGVEKRGRELGITPRMGESYADYKARVGEADRLSRATRAA